MLILALSLTVGFGYDFAGNAHSIEENPLGIIDIKQEIVGGVNVGYYHASSMKDGLKPALTDINMLYITKTFEIKL